MPDLVYNVKFNIEDPSKAGAGKSGAETIVTGYNRAEQAAENFGQEATKAGQAASNAAKKAARDTASLANAQNQITAGAKRMNSSFSSTNQVLFSFSDGIQDASQFSYGFATGMRAVGNNIGFTAELFGNLSARVREYNNANAAAIASGQAMGKTIRSELIGSLKGPGGAILVINLLITAITMYTRSQEVAKKQTEEAVKQNKALNNILKEQEDRLENIAKLRGIDLAQLETSFVDGYRRVNQEILVIQSIISEINSEEDLRNDLINQRIRLANQGANTDEETRLRIEQQREILNQQIEALENKISSSEKDRSIAEAELVVLLDQLKAFNDQERIAKRIYEVRSRIENENITAILTQFKIQQDQELTSKRRLELEDRITKEIKSRGQEARKQREDDRKYQEEVLSRFLNPPSPEVDPSEEVEKRRMAVIRKDLDATRQLEIFRAKSNIRSIEDFENYYQKEFEALQYQLNAKLITQGEYNLKSAQLDKQRSDARIQIEQSAANMIMGINSNLASSITGLLSSAFQNNKAIAIAETIVSTYFAAQQAYAATLAGAALNPLTAPFAPALAKKASISAIIQGAAKVAAIAATEIGSKSVSSGSSGGSGGSFASASTIRGVSGFQVSGEGPSYTPTMYGPRSFRQEAQISVNVDETGFGLYLKGIDGNLQNDTMFVKSA